MDAAAVADLEWPEFARGVNDADRGLADGGDPGVWNRPRNDVPANVQLPDMRYHDEMPPNELPGMNTPTAPDGAS